MWKCRLAKFCLVFVSVIILVACALSPDKRLVNKHCSRCHPVSVVYSKHYSLNQWENVIRAMKVRGMQSTAEEDAIMAQFLAKSYGDK